MGMIMVVILGSCSKTDINRRQRKCLNITETLKGLCFRLIGDSELTQDVSCLSCVFLRWLSNRLMIAPGFTLLLACWLQRIGASPSETLDKAGAENKWKWVRVQLLTYCFTSLIFLFDPLVTASFSEFSVWIICKNKQKMNWMDNMYSLF